MTPQERRDAILKALHAAIDETVTGKITVSSPHIKGARIYVVADDDIPSLDQRVEASKAHSTAGVLDTPPVPEEMKQEPTSGDPVNEDLFFTDADIENMSKRERKRYEKDLAKAKKKEEKRAAKEQARDDKAIQRMRKDIKKRGFETGVLYELNDPADIYELSDNEITQIKMASIVNKDGYYDFIYPYDYDDVKNDHFSKRTLLVIGGFSVAIILLTMLLAHGLSALF